MRKNLFFVIIAIISIGIIVLNTNNTVKYLTCEDPSNYTYTVNSLTEDEVNITVTTVSSSETFSDYLFHFEEGTLYIGVKFALNPLSDSPNGTFTMNIELDEEISKIVLTGSNNEIQIHPES